MRLADLVGGLADAGIDHQRVGDADVAGIAHDTRQVAPGTLFCCIRGSRVDGHELAADAVEAGATALVVERALDLDVPQVVVPSVRFAMGPLAARFWGDPSRDLAVVGVTGTNGKTTTVALIRAVVEAAGRRCEVIGTLTSAPGGPPTTPDAPELQARLARWRDEGVDVVAMEVSSHALAMGRVDGTWFAAAAFTMLGHDHLDLHGDIESYFAAKASLFRADRTGHAVIRADDEWGDRLLRQLDGSGLILHPYSLADATDRVVTPGGSRFESRGVTFELPMVGDHNIANALCATTCAEVLGIDAATAAAGIRAIGPVAGRFELVDEGQDFVVAVDYAHTPDALATVLAAARQRAGEHARVLVVFGCGGDKDRAKRPEMGRIAAESADVVFVTSDNPRSEDPDAIIDAILSGMPVERRTADTVHRVPDRASAIHHAAREAREHDVVVIAGKGHETTQTFADRVVDFDDRVVAAEAIREVLAG